MLRFIGFMIFLLTSSSLLANSVTAKKEEPGPSTAAKKETTPKADVKTDTATTQTTGSTTNDPKAELAAKNLSTANSFLEENKKKPDVITLPSGLQYKVIKEGQGKTPGPTSLVTVQYKGTLPDGTVFDSSTQNVTLAVNAVIPGWTEALQLMKEGSKWIVYVPPQLGYGEKGIGPIGPNQLLTFEIELINSNDNLNEELKEKKEEWEDTD